MSFSIIGRCARSGQIGIALASAKLAVGGSLDAAIVRGVGGILVQGPSNPRLNRIAASLLGQGWPPKFVIGELQASDQDIALRQVAVIDREDGVCTFSASGTQPRDTGEGSGYAVLVEGKGSAAVVAAMKRAFDADPSTDLDSRLIAALEAGDACALPAGLCSSAMVVWGKRDYSDFDLRVDLHERPVRELRRVYDDFKPTVDFYEARARNPRMTMNAREFAGLLDLRRKEQA